jgi:magnesium chelatase family protein
MAAMVGGGSHAKPGEISLAHKGVLFLDELPEFQRQVLEALRQPLESGRVSVARANLHVTYPARVQLVAAMNPCRCGYFDDPSLACTRAPRCASDYQARISGPLFDRIDMHVDVPAVTAADMALPAPREGSPQVRARVLAARQVQAERLAAAGRPDLRTNAEADGELLDRIAVAQAPARELLRRAADQLRLTARGYNRILRVARTVADLDGAETIAKPHVAEAIGFRRVAPQRR